MQEVEVTGTNADGSARFSIPAPFSDAYDAEEPAYSLLSNKAEVEGASLYGAQSANAYVRNDSSFVCLLLPGDACGEDGCTDCKYQEEAIIFQWATTIPEFNISKEISEGQRDEIQMGGPYTVKVKPSGEDVQYQTNQLLYVDFEGLENYEVELTTQKATISFKDKDMPRGQFENPENYEILKHLNLLKTVQADTWYAFTAPFDIHDVSVIETLSEKQMEKMTRSEALEKQAQENVMIFYDIQHFVIPTEEGRASPMTFKNAIADPTISRGAITLTHYNGSNLMTANYYLYELDSLNDNGEFTTDATGRSLNIDWTPVKRNTGDTIMYKGKTLVYATDKESYPGGDKKLVKFAKGCDLLIHDAQYSTEDYLSIYVPKQGFGHSTFEMALDCKRQVEAKKVVFFHYDPCYNDEKLNLLAEEYADRIIYWGPMGCRTGFYFLVREMSQEDAIRLTQQAFEFIAAYDGEIPGVSAVECGNYRTLNLELAHYEANRYLNVLEKIDSPTFSYGC